MKKTNDLLRVFRYICLNWVIIFGLMTIVATGGGDGGDGGGGGGTTPTAPEMGESVEFAEYSVNVTGYYITTYISGGSGWNGNFVVVELKMKNNLGEERVIYWDQRLEDADGYLYNNEVGPCLQLDSTYGGNSTCLNAEEFNPMEEIEGVIVFDVNDLDKAPFYLRLYGDWPIWDVEDYFCKVLLQ